MKRHTLSIVFCLLFATGSFAQTKSPVEGVWKITEWTEKGQTNTNPEPGLIIFTRGYYSTAILMAPRVALTSSVAGPELTDAKKLELFEQWRWFVGISGTYEVKGTTLVMYPIVAKTTWDTNRKTPDEPEFKLEGSNTLWLIPTGEKATKVGLRMKLTRLE